LSPLKVEPAIAKDHQKVQAIRVYPGKLMKEIDSTIESGETPRLIVKKEFSKSRKVEEVSLVFLGPYHIEDLNYFQTDPATWPTFGEIYMTLVQAADLADKIKRILNAPAREPVQMLLKIQNMTVRRELFLADVAYRLLHESSQTGPRGISVSAAARKGGYRVKRISEGRWLLTRLRHRTRRHRTRRR